MKMRHLVTTIMVSLSASYFFSANAAYFTVDSYEHAIGGAKNQQVTMPAQEVSYADSYGSFTYATWAQPVDTSYIPAGYQAFSQNPAPVSSRDYLSFIFNNMTLPGAPGSLIGNFVCDPAYYACLGIHTITYKLPFAIQAMAGDLFISEGYNGNVAERNPFFELPYLPPPENRPPECWVGGCFSGFWGIVFAEPTDTITIAWRSGDSGANVRLTNLQVVPAREGNNGNGPVRVPEPGTLVLTLLALLVLAPLSRLHAHVSHQLPTPHPREAAARGRHLHSRPQLSIRAQ